MTPSNYDPDKHHRRSVRLRGYDYTLPGPYFVTICTHDRKPVLGAVIEGGMRLSAWGAIAQDQWLATARLRPYVELDAYVVMPNHFHAIVWILDDGANAAREGAASEGTTRRSPTNGRAGKVPLASAAAQFGKPQSHSLPRVIAAYKAAVTRDVNRVRATPGAPLWQRGFFE